MGVAGERGGLGASEIESHIIETVRVLRDHRSLIVPHHWKRNVGIVFLLHENSYRNPILRGGCVQVGEGKRETGPWNGARKQETLKSNRTPSLLRSPLPRRMQFIVRRVFHLPPLQGCVRSVHDGATVSLQKRTESLRRESLLTRLSFLTSLSPLSDLFYPLLIPLSPTDPPTPSVASIVRSR